MIVIVVLVLAIEVLVDVAVAAMVVVVVVLSQYQVLEEMVIVLYVFFFSFFSVLFFNTLLRGNTAIFSYDSLYTFRHCPECKKSSRREKMEDYKRRCSIAWHRGMVEYLYWRLLSVHLTEGNGQA